MYMAEGLRDTSYSERESFFSFLVRETVLCEIVASLLLTPMGGYLQFYFAMLMRIWLMFSLSFIDMNISS